jgi:ubiquinone biosynthesis protein
MIPLPAPKQLALPPKDKAAPKGKSVPALVSGRATAAGATLSSVASSAMAVARSSAAAGTALANSALSSAYASVSGTALANVASSAVAAARSTTAAAVVALAQAPLPSPVALIDRAGFILKFSVRWLLGELWLMVLRAFGRKAVRSVESARDAREFVERLGGMWITLARLTALRGDVLGEDFCRELGRVRDKSLPEPFRAIRKVVEQDLRTVGTTFDEVFAEFEEQPITVRFFRQLHRARLRKGNREVVVRVRMPDALQRIKTDWRYMKVLRFVLEQFEIEPHLRWDDLMFEVKRAADDIMDFRTEVEELKTMGKVLRRRRIYVPRLFPRYCTERVLVAEYLEGVTVLQLMRMTYENPERAEEWMRENKLKRQRIWRSLFNAHHELLFEHNLFCTELLPNAIMLLRGNRLAFVPLGSINTLDADLQRKYRYLYRALLQQDYTKACDYYLNIGPPLPYKDITNMKQASMRALRKWESRTHVKNSPYRTKSLSSAVLQLARCASEQELPTFWNLARLQVAEEILNHTLEFFDPTRSSLKALRAYERSAEIRSIKNATTKRVRKRIDAAVDAAQMNVQLLENFEHDGEYLRRRLMSVPAKLSKVSEILGRMVKLVAKLAVVALLVQVLLLVKHGYHVSVPIAEQGTLGRILSWLKPQSRGSWIVLIIFLFYIRRFLTKLAGQLFAKEVRPGDVS